MVESLRIMLPLFNLKISVHPQSKTTEEEGEKKRDHNGVLTGTQAFQQTAFIIIAVLRVLIMSIMSPKSGCDF